MVGHSEGSRLQQVLLRISQAHCLVEWSLPPAANRVLPLHDVRLAAYMAAQADLCTVGQVRSILWSLPHSVRLWKRGLRPFAFVGVLCAGYCTLK
jgi:hypothetical protein